MRLVQKGFTLLEIMLVVAIIGIISAFAIPQYLNYVARSQVAEIFTLVTELKVMAQQNMETGSCVSVNKAENERTGKYGVAVIEKHAVSSSLLTSLNPKTPTGCRLTYTFNAAKTGVSPKVAGKVVTLDLLNNGELVRTTTNGTGVRIDERFLPPHLRINI